VVRIEAVSQKKQPIYLVRHGETEWSRDGKHTGTSDIPLTERGKQMAALLKPVLAGLDARVWSSPLERARETCRLAGKSDGATVDDDLIEWHYGQYEGKTSAEIRATRPGWWMWRDGCPDGEMGDAVAARVDRMIAKVVDGDKPALFFAHGHVLRVLAVRWLGLPAERGRSLLLGPASISRLGYEHDERVIERWNDETHLVSAASAPHA
jgi:broad specificity phosphatase PhoE